MSATGWFIYSEHDTKTVFIRGGSVRGGSGFPFPERGPTSGEGDGQQPIEVYRSPTSNQSSGAEHHGNESTVAARS